LDFFAGSASTAHAVMNSNAQTGANRKFICVQLPETVAENSVCAELGFKNIADISRERIIRAGKAIKNQENGKNVDVGFRSFSLSSSNIVAWNPDRHDLEKTLLSHSDHLVDGRTDLDILTELLLKRGIELTAPIEKRVASGKAIYSVGFGVIFACLEGAIGSADVEQVGQAILDWYKELEPEADSHVFFRDSAFADDIAKTNMAAILEQNGISHVRSL
jgi:adenine-specific DNA-methyltransferase